MIDRTGWGRLRVSGGDRVRFLQGLTTINIETLATATWGAILSPKGRVLSVVNVGKDEGGEVFVVTTEPSLTEKTRAVLEKYAVMDDVAFEPIDPTHPLHQAGDDPWAAPFVAGAGGSPEDDVARIRAGFLRYGVDVDEDHFPFETPLAKFLDYAKGCYVGQEPIFRVHSQGNSAKALRGFSIEGTAAVAPGAVIKHPAKDNAGAITSSAIAGDHVVALGYLHRTAWEGNAVQIDGRAAIVHELPW
jgi:tRNA-modifying protein YgfZ